VVVRTTSWREGVLLDRLRVLPDRSRIYARIDALPTVALIDFASSSLPTKLHLKKKSGGRKTRR
jgi:hypothetical protein